MQKARRNEDILGQLEALKDLDQEGFERERQRIIAEEISKFPPHVQDRLRRFQWTLDMKRRKCKNALEACFMFHEMLMKQVYGENGLLENLQRLVDASSSAGRIEAEPHQVASRRESVLEDGSSIHTKVVDMREFARKRPLRKAGSALPK